MKPSSLTEGEYNERLGMRCREDGITGVTRAGSTVPVYSQTAGRLIEDRSLGQENVMQKDERIVWHTIIRKA